MDNEVMVISKNIGVVEQMLQGAGFFRCHKSFIINLSKVVEYSRKDGGHILLTNEAEVPVSKERKKDLLSKLNL
jgi:two-component system LytT family response regulator